jgi:hypothetical protein
VGLRRAATSSAGVRAKNSAQGWSRDKVEELFDKEGKADGSVALRYIETITSDAELIGKWAIVSYIEESLLRAEEETVVHTGRRSGSYAKAKVFTIGWGTPSPRRGPAPRLRSTVRTTTPTRSKPI